jgi:nondiscriminating aspartyl-tRNA synthetase
MTLDMHQRITTKEVQHRTDGEDVILAGWAAEIRNLGKIAFITLRDREGVVQLTALKDFKQFALLSELAKESVIAIHGKVQSSKQKAGGKEVILHDIEVISKSDPNLPIDITGTIPTGLDKRLDNRFLDLRNPRNLAIFKVRSMVNWSLRNFLAKEKFIEMQTPKIISAGAEGGATLFPVTYYDKTVYLAQSQQLYKQMMMIAGFEKIFEIGPSFRAEKSHTMRHLTEFTHFDFEMSFVKDEDDVLKVIERMFVQVCKDVNELCADQLKLLNTSVEVPNIPFPRITHAQAIDLLNAEGGKLKHGDDIGTEDEKKLGEIVKKKFNTEVYFLTKFPYALRTFYTMTHGDVSCGFDFEYRGEELASGAQREHRHEVLCKQIVEKGLKAKDFTFYTDPFKFGAPPHGGFGMGVDRLTKKLLNLENIRDAVLFPRDPERVVP